MSIQIELFKRTSQIFFKRTSKIGSHQDVTKRAKKILNSIPHIPLNIKGIQHKNIIDNQFVARHVSCQYPEYTILYIHGGGFIGGTPRTYINVSAQLAKKLQAEVYIIKYPLSPEEPFPAAVNYCLDAYKYLLNLKKDPEKIIIMGDSAGGGLTLSTLLKIRDNALPSPRNAVCFSPLANCLIKQEDMAAKAKQDSMISENIVNVCVKNYLPNINDRSHPYASPALGDFSGIPPIQIFVSTEEVLYQNAIDVWKKATSDGCHVDLVQEKGVLHVWPVMAPFAPESNRALNKAIEFIQEKTLQTLNSKATH
ncbi:hypothetical protein A9Q81_07210 [Gammaproteobacteria bacterium 42_54_T18]|nr:hypothetical protein A9Q81_07210 [Gammaproteobacteria bacterium 42_54_T18]